MAQVIRRSLSPLGPLVRFSDNPYGFRGGQSRIWVFFSGFLLFSSVTNFFPPFLYTHLIHFVSFHFIHPCDGASGVIGRHPSHSQVPHRISSLDPALCRTPVADIYLLPMFILQTFQSTFQSDHFGRRFVDIYESPI